MIKKILALIESRKIEYSALLIFIISLGLVSAFDSIFRKIPTFSLGFLILLYLIRIVTSFRHWKLSKGISFIGAALNWQLCYEVMAIGFALQKWTGAPVLVLGAIGIARIFFPIIGLFILLRWKAIDQKNYKSLLGETTVKTIIGLIICLYLYYGLDMEGHFNDYKY